MQKLVEEFIQIISSQKRYSKHTVISYLNDLNQFNLFIVENYDINDISKINFDILRNWVANLSEKGLAVSTINRKISTLKTYFNSLFINSHIEKNPAKNVVALKNRNKIPNYFTETEMRNFFNSENFDDNFEGNRNNLVIEMIYLTGIRLSELINLKCNDIDYSKNYIKVLGKAKKERLVPISKKFSQKLTHFVSKYKLKNYLFVLKNGKKTYPKKIYRIVKKCLSQFSTKTKISPHILRHTFATHMLNNGADIYAIKEILGHSNLNATQIYTHTSIDKIKKIYNSSHPRA